MEPKFGKEPVFKEKGPKVTIELPNEIEMLQRLEMVEGNPKDLGERFYPELLQKAGKEMTAEGVALTLSSAIRTYESRGGEQRLLDVEDELIDALVPNKEIAARAKSALSTIRAAQSEAQIDKLTESKED